MIRTNDSYQSMRTSKTKYLFFIHFLDFFVYVNLTTYDQTCCTLCFTTVELADESLVRFLLTVNQNFTHRNLSLWMCHTTQAHLHTQSARWLGFKSSDFSEIDDENIERLKQKLMQLNMFKLFHITFRLLGIVPTGPYWNIWTILASHK